MRVKFPPTSPGTGRCRPGKSLTRTARLALGSTAAALTVIPLALAGAGPAGAAPVTTPTAPPPVTILTNGTHRGGDFFISPFGDATTYANGAEILSPQGNEVWFHRPRPATRTLTSRSSATTASAC